MRRFEAIVLSETEPVAPGTLWLRPKKNTLDAKGPKQYDIWYFSEGGWRPIADFDTRYNFETTYNKTSSSDSLVITPTKDPEVGIVGNEFKFSIYDGSRDMVSSKNFVLESGLKKEVDILKNYIATEVKRLDGRIDALAARLNSVETTVGNNSSRLSGVEGRLTSLESVIP